MHYPGLHLQGVSRKFDRIRLSKPRLVSIRHPRLRIWRVMPRLDKEGEILFYKIYDSILYKLKHAPFCRVKRRLLNPRNYTN